LRLNFIIAGVQKAATSALHSFLNHHPDIYLSDRKELHFFDNEALDWSAPDYDGVYHTHFSRAPAGACLGEVTPIYTFWPPAMARIQAYNRNIRLIVSLRDPAARAWSQWRMAIKRKNDDLPFSDAIRSGRQRVYPDGPDDLPTRAYSYIERGFYTPQIQRILNYFPPEQLLIIQKHDLETKFETTLDRISQFLDIPVFPVYPKNEIIFSHKADNARPSREDIACMRDLFAQDEAELKAQFNINLHHEL
jgi:hypothetical protein